MASGQDTRARDPDDDLLPPIVADVEPIGPRPLTETIAAASLSQLVHNPEGRLVYGTMALPSLQLVDVALLAKFPHLQRIVLDNNQITTLAPLQELQSLVHLSAVGNELTEATSLPFLEASSTTLESLDLSHNKLTSLAGVHRLTYLTKLFVSHNQLNKLTATEIGGLTSLQTFAADDNRISSLEKGALRKCPLQHLSLCNNELKSLAPFLEAAASLIELRVSGNSIMHITEIKEFVKLTAFDCAANNVYDITEAFLLADLPLLRRAALIGNPLNSDAISGVEGGQDDAKSDIVRPDYETVQKTDGNANKFSRSVPVASRVPVLKQAQNTPYKADSPDAEDAREWNNLSSEQRYRLSVLWRVPQLLQFDGVDVTEVEAAQARNLEGGVDRRLRINSRLRHVGTEAAGSDVRVIEVPQQGGFTISAGSAALALRRSANGGI